MKLNFEFSQLKYIIYNYDMPYRLYLKMYRISRLNVLYVFVIILSGASCIICPFLCPLNGVKFKKHMSLGFKNTCNNGILKCLLLIIKFIK